MPVQMQKIADGLFKLEDGTYRLDNVRLSYPHLFKPYAKNASENKKFSATLLIPLAPTRPGDPGKAAIAALRNAALALAKSELKMDGMAAGNLCIRNGSGTGKPEQEGHWLLKASETKRPATVGPGNVAVSEEDGVFYAGCYVSVNIRLWAQNNDFGKKINANLLSIRFMRKGDPLGNESARADAADVFAGFEEEEGDGLGSGLDDLDL